jgi:hypothetical protein
MKYLIGISIFIVTAFINSPLLYAETHVTQTSGEIAVNIYYGKDTALSTKYTPAIHLYLLNDKDNILAQIEQLKEQSKAELERLIKQYMLAAEMLTQLAVKTGTESITQHTKDQLSEDFKVNKKRIDAVLEHYQTAIDTLIEQHTLQTHTTSVPRITHHASRIRNIAPGKYRLYGVMTFATTTLRWFEPIVVKGGDRHTVYLTRDNLMNPYWTDLNWWSFMNLDFSKHH